jgi:hypothetical protein
MICYVTNEVISGRINYLESLTMTITVDTNHYRKLAAIKQFYI